jgi:hypothetical protein
MNHCNHLNLELYLEKNNYSIQILTLIVNKFNKNGKKLEINWFKNFSTLCLLDGRNNWHVSRSWYEIN